MIELVLALALATQEPSAQSAPTPEVDALVVAPPKPMTRQEAVKAYVEEVDDFTGNKRLGRFDRQICPGVIGMSAKPAQFVIDRIAERAQQVGLTVQEPGCKANVVIVLTDAPDEMALALYKDHPQTVSRWDLEMTPGRGDLKRFLTTDAPVRWWHVTKRVMADGREYSPGQYIAVEKIGRVSSTTRDDFSHVIIIVDAARVGRVRLDALSDYLAFVALAQVDPEASPGMAPSILNLFTDREAGREPQTGMTSWDFAYVSGLYDARRNVLRVNSQRYDIRDAMMRRAQETAPSDEASPTPESPVEL